MRALTLLLTLFLLEGCLATQRVQHETAQNARLAAERCSATLARVDSLITAEDKTRRVIQQELKARQTPVSNDSRDQSCPDLRKSLNNKTVVGAVEWATLDFGDHQRVARARMDTGASISSVSAHDIAEFERNGKRWARFTLPGGRQVSAVLERYADIRQAAAETDKRRVVRLGIKLGEISQVAEFTLKDRRHLNYEILVGRNLLRDLMVVDVARRYVLGRKPKLSATETPTR